MADFDVEVSSDDCTTRANGGGWFFTNLDQIYIGDYSATFYDYEGGMRWTVDIPQGAIIGAASLSLVAVALAGAIPTIIIEGEAADDPLTFSNFANYDARVRTTAKVNWTPAAWVAGTTYTSIDIKDIIQEMVNRAGFGTHIVLFLSHASGWGGGTERITAASYDHATYDSPKLHIEYTPPPANLPANPLIGKPLISPNIIKKAKIR